MIRYVLFLGVISTLTSFYINCDDQIHHYTNQFVVWCENKSKDDNNPEWTLPEKLSIEKLNIPSQDCLYLVTDTSKPKGTRSIEQDTNTVETLMAQRKVNNVEQQEYNVRVKRTEDTEWSKLWYLNGAIIPSMKIQEAWNLGYNGSGITIAVVDDGVETNHTDLDSNMYSGYHYDFVDNDTDPDPGDGNDHGTKCSGLIVAEANNSECIVGVAYGAKVIGVRLLASEVGTTDLQESQSLSHQRSVVDIYTNSWGPPDGSGYYDTGSLVKAALLSGVTTGRSGKGAIFTWAAGNGDEDDNCNGDGYVNSIYTIGVISLGSNGKPASYTEVCVAAMATTYGGSYPESFLYSTAYLESCAKNLQGTSYSTAVAAGIIALTLQANPNLNWRDVQHLIVLTSKRYRLSDFNYGWEYNGAKKYVHARLGFGLMDAEDMVKYASIWKQVPNQLSFQSSMSSPLSNVNASGFKDSITIGSSCSIRFLEHVQVQINFQAQSIGDVEFTLISPSGTYSSLMTTRPGDYNVFGNKSWTFMTVHFWGEAPQGQWNLSMVVQLRTGLLYNWNLILYGTQNDPLPNIDVCSGNPCAVLELACEGNNYGFDCVDAPPTTTTISTTATTVSSSTTAAIAGGVAAGIVVLGIAVAIVAIVVRLKLARAATIAPVTT
ncbi:hypothetical protein CHS0354_022825 [Potamilus streckersoni]|uniref:P/Homo B domain-containing protein n=1 Tax=Potamilus streckersoni TaxID=2493646 RepID=A0AAE0VP28_9BIVA|nr:hypothetical protein CHS0354_022825 [Potamilus streckersoni]